MIVLHLAAEFWFGVVWPSRWSALLVAMGLLSQELVARRRKGGYVVGLATQAVWVGYALVAHQVFFLVSAAAFTLLYSRAWLRWRRIDRTVAA